MKFLKKLIRLYRTLDVISEGDKSYLIPSGEVSLGHPNTPFCGIAIEDKTFYMQRLKGVDYERLAITYSSLLDSYIIKPEKGGVGALKDVVISGTGAIRDLNVGSDGKVGVNRKAATRPFEVGGPSEFLGQIYLSPGAMNPPFVLSANALGQLVTGLNAELHGGVKRADLPGAVIDVDTTDFTITGTTAKTTVYSITVPGGLLESAKCLVCQTLLEGAYNADSILEIEFGGESIFKSDANIRGAGNTWIECFLTYQSNTQTQCFTKIPSGIMTAAGALQFGAFGVSSANNAMNQTLRISIKPDTIAKVFIKKFAMLRRIG